MCTSGALDDNSFPKQQQQQQQRQQQQQHQEQQHHRPSEVQLRLTNASDSNASKRSTTGSSSSSSSSIPVRIFKLLISCLLMFCIYINSWHIQTATATATATVTVTAAAYSSSIRGRGDAYKLASSSLRNGGRGSGGRTRLTQSNNHANISELLDNLLRGYDNSIRPDFGGPPATVEVDIMVRSMGPISEVDMTYSMDCYFRQSWVDKRLAFEGAQDTLALSVSMLARIWKPDTYFYNGKQSYLHTITTPNKFVRIYQNGRVLYSSRLTIKAGCPMNLADFPMDIQKCPLKFGSFGYTTADVIYRWNKERPAVAIAEDMKLSQFDLVDCPAGNLTDIVYKAAAPTKSLYNNKDFNTILGGVIAGTDSSSRHNNNTNTHNNTNNKKYSKSMTTFAGPGAKNQHIRGTGLKLDKGAFGSGHAGAGAGSGGSGGNDNNAGAGRVDNGFNGLGGAVRMESNEPSEYSMLMVNFHLQRHMGNFLIQVYGPCCLLVVLSWVSFWLNREATADRVSLGITTVLTMTFLGLEARTDLPKVPYPTALDFFVFLSFAFIFATILQFAVVHYFTKYGSGECYFIIEDVESDTESEAEARNAMRGAINSEFNVSTESKIYEVIPLSMCAITIPPASYTRSVGEQSASSSGIGIGSRSRLGLLSGQTVATTAAATTSTAGTARRNRRISGGYTFNCLDWAWFSEWRRARQHRRVDINTSEDEDDEQTHLRSAEASTSQRAAASGRRRMSFYRREEMEARRKGKRTPQYNSVSKIDRASRIVFPLLFFLINVFYWYGYLSRSSRILTTTPTST